MAKQTQSIVVEQYYNPKFNSTQPVDKVNCEYVYKVLKTVNTIQVAIGQRLNPTQLQSLIASDINVTVQPVN